MSTRLGDTLTSLLKALTLVTVVVAAGLTAVSWSISAPVRNAALIAAGVGLVLVAMTWASVTLGRRQSQLLGAALMGDYLAKVVVVLVTVLVARGADAVSGRALGYGLVVVLLTQAVTQTWILMRAKIQTIDLAKNPNQ